MASNETVRLALLEMGVEHAKALHASQRYETPEAAINWVFGEGESWTPEAWVPEPSPPARHSTPVDSGPVQKPIKLGSNNPFLNAGVGAGGSAGAGAGADGGGGGSGAGAGSAGKVEEDRSERERSVRASAPPPDAQEEGEVIGTLFGPSEKEDKEGKLAVTVAAPDTSNKEEEDFQRAIQESMMTASFTSEAPAPALAPPTEREVDAPVVYVSTTQQAFGAHILQAMAAVPQLRGVVAGLWSGSDDTPELDSLKALLALQGDESDSFTDSYTLVDKEIAGVHGRRYVGSIPLPPNDVVKDAWFEDVEETLTNALRAQQSSGLMDLDDASDASPAYADFKANPEQLLGTVLASSPEPRRYVTMERSMSEPCTVHEHLAKVMWAPDAPGESIDRLADVIFVSLYRTPGIAAPKWQFDQTVVLDRYLTHNKVWATQERAAQGVIQGELRRLQERKEVLTTFRGHSLPAALKVLEKQLADASDEAKADLKEKLERVSEALAAKLAALQAEAQGKEEKLKGASFETSDPTRQQHKYVLRAILWHDGFNTPGSHLYAYVHHKGSWWRIADSTATRTNWAAIEADNTGQFTDGGPYVLVYSRDGPRPPPPPRSPSPSAESDSLLDGSSIEEAMEVSSPDTPPSAPSSGVAPLPPPYTPAEVANSPQSTAKSRPQPPPPPPRSPAPGAAPAPAPPPAAAPAPAPTRASTASSGPNLIDLDDA